jgi:hypothetical protein
MERILVRRTVRGATIGGLLFGVVALVQALRAGAPFPGVLGPLAVFTLIGLTTGGLAGPLLAQARERRRESRSAQGSRTNNP